VSRRVRTSCSAACRRKAKTGPWEFDLEEGTLAARSSWGRVVANPPTPLSLRSNRTRIRDTCVTLRPRQLRLDARGVPISIRAICADVSGRTAGRATSKSNDFGLYHRAWIKAAKPVRHGWNDGRPDNQAV